MSTDSIAAEIERILQWAEKHAEQISAELVWKESAYGLSDGFWKAADPLAVSRVRAQAIAALDFLERYAGTGSRWAVDAHDVFNSRADNRSMESGAQAIGDVLRQWVAMVRSGQTRPRLIESFSIRAASSTDLLEQVRALNADKKVTPAAPIMLAGAALEIALRVAVEELGLTVETTRASIDAYAQALRQADVLTRQDMKDITQMAGLRNDAAHGNHDDLDRTRAGLMEQQVNVFLTRLDDVVEQAKRVQAGNGSNG